MTIPNGKIVPDIKGISGCHYRSVSLAALLEMTAPFLTEFRKQSGCVTEYR